MSKTRVVVYMDAGLLGQVDGIAERSAVSRSAVLSAAVVAGIEDAAKHFSPKRQGQGSRLFPRSGAGYLGRRRSPATVHQRKAIAFGQALLRVNPSLPPDQLRDALVDELSTYLPGVPAESLDFDALVDSLYAGSDGNLVPVPGDAPPEDAAP